MAIGSVASEHEDARAKHDGHIGDIENSRANGANPNVHEIDHCSINDPIHEIRGATGYQQSDSEESPSGPALPHGEHGYADEEQAAANTEDGCSDGYWPVCTETQEGAIIRRVLETKRVGQE
jgi:hypothetical protein